VIQQVKKCIVDGVPAPIESVKRRTFSFCHSIEKLDPSPGRQSRVFERQFQTRIGRIVGDGGQEKVSETDNLPENVIGDQVSQTRRKDKISVN
jgi:hypothetical protein